MGLVLDLLRRGLLPAIAFSFERRVCHALAEQLVLYLEVGGGGRVLGGPRARAESTLQAATQCAEAGSPLT